ncbi:MAG: hypothetical protein IT395_01015 [Candidatus Omnitrophica bacterium]|nr:hypothetical protein [Candidatus Omnitrophota bacterium]
MKAFMAFLVIVAVLAGLYYGYIFVISKSFKSNPKPDVTETTSSWQSQSEKNDALMQRQRDLMQQRQERMRDMQRR